MMDDRPERQPLPSEDGGDLVDEPSSGETDDYLVASAEGVPYTPRDGARAWRGVRCGGAGA